MRFGVLGPLEVRDGYEPVAIGGGQQRVVLAILLADPGSVVSTDRLIDEIWGDSPPASARKAVQSYVAQLRRSVNRDGGPIVGRDGGYVAVVDDDELDSARFGSLVADGRARLGTEPAQARQVLAEALGLWRGPPYEGLADESPALQVEAQRLEELRAAAVEAKVRADLVLGEAAALVPELEAAMVEHPLRERLRAMLMVALHRAGRSADALAAYQDARRVMVEELGLDPSAELQSLEQRILDQDESLSTGDPFAVESAAAPVVEIRNPYKGLRAFDEADVEDFHGREALVTRLLERLGRRDVAGRLLLLAGASGSGKSSIVRAGLVPALRRGAPPDLAPHSVVSLFPGEDPVGAWDRALEGLEPPAAPGDPLVVVVDQLEEVFTLASPDLRDSFLDTVVAAVTARAGQTRVIATIRADFLDRPLQHSGLAPLVQPGLELVPPLDEREIREAVAEPARSVGVAVEPELVAEIAQLVANRPTSLPLLQFTLTDLFDRRSERGLTSEAFHAAGGLLGGLARRADELVAALSHEETEAARQIFLRLVTISDDTEDLRRRVPRSELTGLPFREETIDDVLERFGSQRLLTFDRDPATGEPTVEVPHEALLREWPRLSSWIDDARQDLVSHRRLAEATTEWLAADRDESYAVRGTRLAEFESLAGSAVTLTRAETEYVDSGRRLVRAEEAARSRRRRTLSGVLVVATVLALTLAGFALVQRTEANDQRSEAREQAAEAEIQRAEAEAQAAEAEAQRSQADTRTREAQARELAAAAVAGLDSDPELSVLLALEAVAATAEDGVVLREAEEALHRAVQANRHVYTLTDTGPSVEFSPLGDLLATADNVGSVHLRDIASGRVEAELPGIDEPFAGDTYRPMIEVSFSGDGSRLAASSGPGFISGPGSSAPPWPTYVWDTASGMLVDVVYGSSSSTSGLALDLDGDRLVTASLDGGVRQWDVPRATSQLDAPSSTTEEPTQLYAADAPVPVDLDDLSSLGTTYTTRIPSAYGVALDGSGLLYSQGVTVYLRDIDRPETEPLVLAAHNDDVLDTDAGDGLVVSASLDGTARLFDPVDGSSVAVIQNGSPVESVTIDPGGERVATGDLRGKVRVWSVETGELLLTLNGHSQPVSHLSFSPDGSLLASGSARAFHFELSDVAVIPWQFIDEGGFDGEVRVWDVSVGGAAEVATLPALRGGVEIELTGGTTVTESNIARGRAGDVEFSPDGDLLAVTEGDGSVTIWTGDGQERTAVLEGHTAPVVGVAWSPDGSRIATVAPNGVRLWDPRSGAEVLTLADDGPSLRDRSSWFVDVAYSPDGERVGASQKVGRITHWDSATGAEFETTSLNFANGLDYDPDGLGFATGSFGGSFAARVVGPDNAVLLDLPHDDIVEDVVYSPDGTALATLVVDGRVFLWDLGVDGASAGSPVEVRAPGPVFRALEYSPDGATFATGGEDGNARIWDSATGEELLTLQPHDDAVVGLSYSPDGTRLATISPDGTARILFLDVEELVDLARERVTRELTDDECRRYLHTDGCES